MSSTVSGTDGTMVLKGLCPPGASCPVGRQMINKQNNGSGERMEMVVGGEISRRFGEVAMLR